MLSKRYLGALRALLLAVGAAAFCWAVVFGGTLPEPPPNSDGVPTGFAVVGVLLGQFAGALIAQAGFALPAGTGRLRFGPLADRSPAFRAGVALAGFAVATLLLTVVGWVLPESLPRVVSQTHGFLSLGMLVGTGAGVVLTVPLAAGTAVWRLAHDEPLLAGVDG